MNFAIKNPSLKIVYFSEIGEIFSAYCPKQQNETIWVFIGLGICRYITLSLKFTMVLCTYYSHLSFSLQPLLNNFTVSPHILDRLPTFMKRVLMQFSIPICKIKCFLHISCTSYMIFSEPFLIFQTWYFSVSLYSFLCFPNPSIKVALLQTFCFQTTKKGGNNKLRGGAVTSWVICFRFRLNTQSCNVSALKSFIIQCYSYFYTPQ